MLIVSESFVDNLNRREFVKGVGAVGITGNILNLDGGTVQIGDVSFDPNEEVAYVAGWSNNLKGSGDAYVAGVHHASTSSGEPVATTAETTENILNGNWMTQ